MAEKPPEKKLSCPPKTPLAIPGVKAGKDLYRPYVPEKYRKAEKSLKKQFMEAAPRTIEQANEEEE